MTKVVLRLYSSGISRDDSAWQREREDYTSFSCPGLIQCCQAGPNRSHITSHHVRK